VSSKGSVTLLREAKKRGLPVTAETAPHYFCLVDQCLETYDTNFRVNPPLRGEADRDAIIEGLKDGTLDCIASDHAPHAAEEKQVEFDHAPPGMIGLETTLALVITHLVKPGHLSLPEAISLITNKPAKTLGIPGGTLARGEAADLVLFDAEEMWEVTPRSFHSKSCNSPYIGQSLAGKVKHTILDGRLLEISKVQV
jgi:dihydroorotase